MSDNIPADGYFEEMLEAVTVPNLEARWEREALDRGPEDVGWRDRWANRWAELSEIAERVPLRVKTEPVLHDPRPVKVKVHGKTYHVHRVVYGHCLGCSRVDAQPGTILPPTIHVPGKALIGV